MSTGGTTTALAPPSTFHTKTFKLKREKSPEASLSVLWKLRKRLSHSFQVSVDEASWSEFLSGERSSGVMTCSIWNVQL